MRASTGERADAESERALLERARAGDRAAQDILVRRYLPDVYRVTFRLLGSRERAEDATQDAFISALRALPRFRGESGLRTWILRIAANAARSQGRRWSRHREVQLTDAGPALVATEDVARSLEQQAEVARVERALRQLPSKQRLAVALRAQQGLSYREIAALAGGTEGAARVNYHLGIKRLRELLA